MEKISLLDQAQLKLEFRQLYKELGVKGMLQVLYELCISVQLCLEVIKEESINERD